MPEEKNNNQSNTNTIEQYKCYLQDIGNIGTRHENSRRFYLSVVSALFVFLSMTGENGPFLNMKFAVQIIVGIVGGIMCIVWVIHMQSFRAIFKVKFKVIVEIEKENRLLNIFEREHKYLNSDNHYNPLTVIDSIAPYVFMLLFITIMFIKKMDIPPVFK
jgi:hypothetical protein